MKKYFTLKLGRPNVKGGIIELDMSEPRESRLKDFIASYVNANDNLGFRVLEKTRGETIYEATVPEMRFSGGGRIPALAVSADPGWSRTGQKKVRLRLTSRGNLSPLENDVYIDEISRQKALGLKKDEFNYSMQQLYIAGF